MADGLERYGPTHRSVCEGLGTPVSTRNRVDGNERSRHHAERDRFPLLYRPEGRDIVILLSSAPPVAAKRSDAGPVACGFNLRASAPRDALLPAQPISPSSRRWTAWCSASSNRSVASSQV